MDPLSAGIGGLAVLVLGSIAMALIRKRGGVHVTQQQTGSITDTGRHDAVPWISGLDQRLSSVDSRLTKVEGRLGGIEGQVSSLDRSLQGALGRFDSSVDRLERAVKGHHD